MADEMKSDLIAMTTDVVAAYVSNNKVAASEVADLVASIHSALSKTTEPVAEPETEKKEPAVPVRSSIKHDYIVCLEDGAKLKMLKRYLRTNYDMSPERVSDKMAPSS
jgi:predicted transcriptional regulator